MSDASPNQGEPTPAYGAHVTFHVRAGGAPKVAGLLLRAAETLRANAACRLYLVGTPVDVADAVSVTELWDDDAAHAASLELPGVRAIITEVLPLLAGPPIAVVFCPEGGKWRS